MKHNERVLLPGGRFASFPKKELDKAVKMGLTPEPVKEEIKEVEIKLPSKEKRKANRSAKKENMKLAKKEEKQANEQRLSGN